MHAWTGDQICVQSLDIPHIAADDACICPEPRWHEIQYFQKHYGDNLDLHAQTALGYLPAANCMLLIVQLPSSAAHEAQAYVL